MEQRKSIANFFVFDKKGAMQTYNLTGIYDNSLEKAEEMLARRVLISDQTQIVSRGKIF